MKPFDQTRFFNLLEPFVLPLLHKMKSQRFLTRILISFILFYSLLQLVNLITSYLGETVDYSFPFYILVVVTTVSSGNVFWFFWYSVYQLIQYLFPGHQGSRLPPRLLSFSITSGFVFCVMGELGERITQEGLLVARCMVAIAYCFWVVMPTLWVKPTHFSN